jgi:hypothetical protein
MARNHSDLFDMREMPTILYMTRRAFGNRSRHNATCAGGMILLGVTPQNERR